MSICEICHKWSKRGEKHKFVFVCNKCIKLYGLNKHSQIYKVKK
jgi:hypothetical protein